jgi:alginate O-acetyltransferase complex protein AlgI
MPISIVGISYMVFRGLSYIIDIELIENRGFVSYLNYILFFPTLLSGPIARFEPFQASIDKKPAKLEFKTQLMILNRIANGFLKKYLLADNLFVFTQYNNISVLAQQNLHHQVAAPMFWLGALLNLATIYFDFSGYCDIAIGIGQLMGVDIPENFDAPFSARDLQEFWGRWHMSLTNFIKDYVFTPLVRVALFSAPVSMRWLLITACYAFSMVLISLWHGTTVNCLLFGFVQATALIMIQIKKRLNMRPLPVPIACLANYCFMSFTIWVGTLPDNQLLPVLKKMFGMGG